MTLKQAIAAVQKDDVSYQEIHDASIALRRIIKLNKASNSKTGAYIYYYNSCMNFRVGYELNTGKLRKDTCDYIYNHLKAGKTEIDGIQLNDEVLYKVIDHMSKGITDTKVKIKTRSKRLSQIEYIRSCIKEES